MSGFTLVVVHLQDNNLQEDCNDKRAVSHRSMATKQDRSSTVPDKPLCNNFSLSSSRLFVTDFCRICSTTSKTARTACWGNPSIVVQFFIMVNSLRLRLGPSTWPTVFCLPLPGDRLGNAHLCRRGKPARRRSAHQPCRPSAYIVATDDMAGACRTDQSGAAHGAPPLCADARCSVGFSKRLVGFARAPTTPGDD